MDEPEFSKEVNIAISDNSLNNDIKDLYKNKFARNKSIKFHDSKEFECLDSNVNRAVEIASENMFGFLVMMILLSQEYSKS